MLHPNDLDQQLDNLRTLQESYDQIATAAEAYNVGKTQLAAAITAKGVETQPTETYPEMAEKVSAISQESYTIDGGEMYAKQLFGSLETPNYWNLYDILAQLLSDGRLVNYGGILLAEYYKGYDSLALAGAGAGGAYVVSDKDENGQFKMYTEDTTHTWATEFDGKGNRWVAYCFADEYHDFQITDTNISPRSAFIGRKVGTITSLVNGRLSEIVVTGENELREFAGGGYSQNWGVFVHFKVNEIGKNLINNNSTIEKLYIEAVYNKQMTSSGAIISGLSNLNSVILKIDEWRGQYGQVDSYFLQQSPKAKSVTVISEKVSQQVVRDIPNLVISFIDIEEMAYIVGENIGATTKKVYFAYKTGANDKSRSVNFVAYDTSILDDVELRNGWCKPLNVRNCTSLTKENVQAHIFDRLGVNDLSTGAVTITLANAVLNLFTQEEIDAVVERTNITIIGA